MLAWQQIVIKLEADKIQISSGLSSPGSREAEGMAGGVRLGEVGSFGGSSAKCTRRIGRTPARVPGKAPGGLGVASSVGGRLARVIQQAFTIVLPLI